MKYNFPLLNKIDQRDIAQAHRQQNRSKMLTALLFSLASNQRTFLQKAGRVGERGGLGGEEEKEETGLLFSFSWLSHLFPIWYDF